MKAADFTKIPISEITTPKPGLVVMRGAWWVITEDDCVLFYTRGRSNSPQCNVYRRITDMMLDRYEKLGLGKLQSKFIEIAFKKQDGA